MDLTGGVAPWERPTARTAAGRPRRARVTRGSTPQTLLAAGWVYLHGVGERAVWRDPVLGDDVRIGTARHRLAARHTPGEAPAKIGRPRAADDGQALDWLRRVEAGEPVKAVALDSHVAVDTVRSTIARIRGAA